MTVPQLSVPAIRAVLVDLAAAEGVELHALGDDFASGLHFAYQPAQQSRPEIHLSCMLVNWRICESDRYSATYRRHWCFAGTGVETFTRAVKALAAWDGDPDTEPAGWVKTWDGRTTPLR